MSRSTLRHAVRKQQQLRFDLGPEWKISGWLCGIDDYHYKVVDLYGTVYLIHKTQCVVAINEDGGLLPEDLREIIAPFQQSMEREHSGSGGTPARDS